MMEDYWRGYVAAIKHVDATLRARGDDSTIRECRRAIAALVKVPYEPKEVMPVPDWAAALTPHKDGGKG